MNPTLLQRLTRYLKWIGLHPQLNSKPFALTHFLVAIIGTVSLLMEMILRWRNLEELANAGQMFIGAIQRILAATILVIYRKHFLKILSTVTNQFWSLDKFEEGLQREVLAIHTFIKQLFIRYEYLMVLGGTAYFLKPLFENKRKYPIHWYEFCDIHNNACYVLNYISQVLFVANQYIIYLGFDGMFYAMTSHLYTELMLIKHGFVNMVADGDEEKTMKEFKVTVEHHNVVLSCYETLQQILSLCFVWQFLGSFLSICAEILVMLSNGFPPTLLRIIQSGNMMVCFYSQIFIYCLVGEQISKQTESVVDAAYESDWWKHSHLKLRKGMLIVMQRVRARSSFTVGNVLNLNIAAFAEVVKKTMTFFTFVKTMYEIQNQ